MALRGVADAGVHRVAGDVGDRGPELLVGLDEARPVATLEQMAAPAVAVVEGPGVEAVEAPHSRAEVRLACLDERMDVIAHQAVGEQPPAHADRDAGELEQLRRAISIVPEDALTVVPPGVDVVNARNFVARSPVHTRLRPTPRKLAPLTCPEQ